MDPLVSSAAATVKGIRTEILAEQAIAGTAIDEIADDFDLSVDYVKAALAHEFRTAA
jgi:uncharacterized protein (DUF433 family)